MWLPIIDQASSIIVHSYLSLIIFFRLFERMCVFVCECVQNFEGKFRKVISVASGFSSVSPLCFFYPVCKFAIKEF